MPDEFDSGDELFDGIDLAKLEDPDYGDDLFDGLDEAELVKLESPTQTPAQPGKRSYDNGAIVVNAFPSLKRQKSSQPTSLEVNNTEHLALAERLLSEKFGYKSFRHEQAGAIQRILAGQNTLVVFPTGAGKSLCYQIPAIAFPELDKAEGLRASGKSGVTIVVSPLIALMKDQVDALQKRGIAADCIDSTKKYEQTQLIYASLQKGQLRILYCAPERLDNEGFVERLKEIPGGIRLLAVDEAHCISEWGHSFRPDYLKVARFVDELKAERVVCLTATATPKVAADICKAFNIQKECVFQTSPYRPNLHLHAQPVETRYDDISHFIELVRTGDPHINDKRFEEMFRFLRNHPGPSLVYVAVQAQAEHLADALRDQGFNAAPFHAGMKTEDKQTIQEKFMASEIEIVCATIAFGMGIDKPNIRNIIHWDMSNTVEEYSQQIGRAGRDGLPSRCMFYLTADAFYMREVFARGDLPSRQCLRALLEDIFKQGAGLSVGGVFKVSHYSQSGEFDIRPSPLSIIYATLDLHFGLIRAITPEYAKYQFEAYAKYLALKHDKTPEGKAIFSHAVKKAKYYHIDVNKAAQATGLARNDIVRKLNHLGDNAYLKLQTSGIEHRYRILKKLPKTDKEIDAVLDKLYADLKAREKEALLRAYQIMDLITGRKCFARALAEHFGMNLRDGKSECGHCTFCLTGKPVRHLPRPRRETTAASIQEVLKATNVRDDPRFLARVAFGIKSPRVTKLRLDKHRVFRSLADHDFEALVLEFEKVCRVSTGNSGSLSRSSVKAEVIDLT
ncbi:P-loop containing nucleoside triphosphate hydrolase protein [Diplogelasinospora grovesii]|uniref:DNA 3'-5' helicase n=1 Tax=Diplogelasinospora grovesii TaxID=303347 RepID=A0AAN6MZS5_9PEZI|nr:P-loop containing nucleoside triphosphate hydrolase protein [Diplogelasinospora grovesii]